MSAAESAALHCQHLLPTDNVVLSVLKCGFFPYPFTDHVQKGLLQVKTNGKGNPNPKENETCNTGCFSESACN